MYKDVIISFLTAELIIQSPWIIETSGSERMAAVVGIATAVFIFLLFLEDCYEKFRKYAKRVQKIRRTVERLRKGA